MTDPKTLTDEQIVTMARDAGIYVVCDWIVEQNHAAQLLRRFYDMALSTRDLGTFYTESQAKAAAERAYRAAPVEQAASTREPVGTVLPGNGYLAEVPGGLPPGTALYAALVEQAGSPPLVNPAQPADKEKT